MQVDYLIIGAGIAGTTAAEAIRSRDPLGSIVIVGDETHALYSRVLLPLVTDKRIPAEKAFLKKDDWYTAHNIQFVRGRRVIDLRQKLREAILDDGTVIRFTQALIATGGRPRRADIPGEHLLGVHRLQTIEDAISLRDLGAKNAIVIGGGFIALEFLNTFLHYKCNIKLLLRRDRLWQDVFDEAASGFLERHLESKGVQIIRNVAVRGFAGEERVTGVVVEDGSIIESDVVGLGIGLEMNMHFVPAQMKGKHGVKVDSYLETMYPGIFAVGDVAEFDDVIAGHQHSLGNWANAQEQGRVVGATMTGTKTEFRRVSSYSIPAAGMNVAFVGDPASPGEKIVRGDGKHSYALLTLREGVLKGGVFLNRIADRGPAAELIAKQTNISAFRKEIADEKFDLKSILAEPSPLLAT